MARYIGPKTKIARKFGAAIFVLGPIYLAIMVNSKN